MHNIFFNCGSVTLLIMLGNANVKKPKIVESQFTVKTCTSLFHSRFQINWNIFFEKEYFSFRQLMILLVSSIILPIMQNNHIFYGNFYVMRSYTTYIGFILISWTEASETTTILCVSTKKNSPVSTVAKIWIQKHFQMLIRNCCIPIVSNWINFLISLN